MKFNRILIAAVAAVGSLVSTAGELFTYEFENVILTPEEVTNLVMSAAVDPDLVEEIAREIVEQAGGVDQQTVIDIVDGRTIKTNNVVDLIHANVSGIDTNAVEDIAAYQVSNTVATVALTGQYSDLIGKPTDIAEEIESMVEQSVAAYSDGMTDILRDMSNVVIDARTLFKMHTDSSYSNLANVVAFSEAAKSNITDLVVNYGNSVETYFHRAIDTVAPAISNELSKFEENVIAAEYWTSTNAEFKVSSDTVEFAFDIYPSISTNTVNHLGNPCTYSGLSSYRRHDYLKVFLRIARDDLLKLANITDVKIPCMFKTYEVVDGVYVSQSSLFIPANIFKMYNSNITSTRNTFVVQTNGVTQPWNGSSHNSVFDWYQYFKAAQSTNDAGCVYLLDTPIYDKFDGVIPEAGRYNNIYYGEYLMFVARSTNYSQLNAMDIEPGATTSFFMAAYNDDEYYANTACPLYVYSINNLQYSRESQGTGDAGWNAIIRVCNPPAASTTADTRTTSVTGSMNEQYCGITGTNSPVKIRSVGGPVIKYLVPVERVDGPVLTSNQVESLILDIIGRGGSGE